MKLGSWRLAKEDSGGGSENEPVGTLKDLVGTLKLPVKALVSPPEPDSGGGREEEPVGALYDLWEKDTVKLDSWRLARDDGGGSENEPVGTQKDPVGTLKDPVGTLKLPVKELVGRPEPVGPPEPGGGSGREKDPVKPDSWRLATLGKGGGGGAEWEPVGMLSVNDPVDMEWDS